MSNTSTVKSINNPDFKLIQFPTLIQNDNKNIENNIDTESNSTHERPSAYTSVGKPKARPADPIRSLEDIKKIENYFLDKQDFRDNMLWIVGISVGLRISDLLSLRISDVLTESGIFKKRIYVIEKKTSKPNNSIITITMQKAITLYLNSLKEKNCDYDIKNHINDFLFMSRKGFNKAMTEISVHKLLKQMSRDLGLDAEYNVGTHTMRKTHYHMMYENETNKGNTDAIDLVQTACNHSDKRTTYRYLGIEQERVDEAKQGVSDLLEQI